MSQDYKPQLHVSMLNQMSKCGIQFQRRYGSRFGVWHEEEIIPPSVAALTGRSVHTSVERNVKNIIEHGTILRAAEVAEIARNAFDVEWQGGVLLTDEEAINTEKTRGSAIDMTVNLSGLHWSEIAPKLKPVAAEMKFVIALDGYPIDLGGTIDIVEDGIVRDTKTMAANKSSVQSTQMAMYAVAYKTDPDMGNGEYPAKLVHDKLIKTKKPKTAIEEIKPDPIWIDPLFKRIERFIEIIDAVKSGKQAFTPASPDDWVCTKKYCGFALTCPYWSGR